MRKKLIALMLCFAMIVSIGATTIFALEGDSSPFSEENLQESDVPESEDGIKNVTALFNKNIEDEDLPTESIYESDDLGDSSTSSTIEPTKSEEDPLNQGVEPTEPKGGFAEETLSAEEKLYNQIMTCESFDALDNILNEVTDEQLDSLVEWLDKNGKLSEVEAKIQLLTPKSVIPLAVNFTEAGPLLPAVNYGGLIKRSMITSYNDKGVVLNKTATLNDDYSYKIRLEAYATGESSTIETTDPVDIVLVLDQSGSMTYSFTGSNNRQDALKTAVNSFIDGVAEKYSEQADHRISIVTFAGSSSTRMPWTFVNPSNKDNIKNNYVNNLPNPNGATNVGAGMSTANGLISGQAGYSGPNENRKKVVILFTDGVPTTSSDFSTDVATSAIVSSKNMKDNGVTVYSIGIFDGANPAQLYGEKWSYTFHQDIICNGNVGSYWGGSWLASLTDNDFPAIDVPAGNRFLNYLSSNYSEATEIGVTRGNFNPGGHPLADGKGYRIEENFDRIAPDKGNYYLTANNTTDLTNIFETINQEIGGAGNTTLTSQSTIRDTVSKYFDVPTETDSVKFYTADCTGIIGSDLTFEDVSEASDVNGSFDEQKLIVSGFDFSANWCGDHSGNYSGKKLIIEFNVTPKDGFLGGNGVPTNKGEDDGIYDPAGKLVDSFIAPTVNVPIPVVNVTALYKNVYLTNTLSDKQLLENATASAGTSNNLTNFTLSSDGDKFILPTGDDEWKGEFVTLETKINRNGDETFETQLMSDSKYSVTVSIAPKTGDQSGAKSGTSSPDSKINVFKPVLTFEDSDVWYGGDVPDYADTNFVSELWKYGNTEAKPENMIGEKPALSLTYTPKTGKISAGRINSKTDIPVSVGVKIGEQSVQDYTSFVHQACDPVCGWETPNPNNGDPAFLLHVKTGKLTITKSGGNAGEPYVFDILKNGVKYTEVTIVQNETNDASVTIYELPVGSYSIVENKNWSWRFNPEYSAEKVVLGDTNLNGSLTCTNTANNDKTYWLNGYSEIVKNIFGVSH